MILYNTTVIVEHAHHAAWLQFMERDYIPFLLESGLFEGYQLCRVVSVDETDGLTYAFLLELASRPTFEVYREKHAAAHEQMHDGKWREKAVVFRSVLDVVASGKA